jgi:hypothetical protein
VDFPSVQAITDNIITTLNTGIVNSKGTEIFIGILEIIERNIFEILEAVWFLESYYRVKMIGLLSSQVNLKSECCQIIFDEG